MQKIPELATPKPPRVAALRTDRRGYPIFFTVLEPEGEEPDFRQVDAVKRMIALREKLCGICGETLDNIVWGIGGPASLRNRLFADPPMHYECALYAFKVCPFNARPNMKYLPIEKAKQYEGYAGWTDDSQQTERPKHQGLMSAFGYKMVRLPKGEYGVVAQLNEPALSIAWQPQVGECTCDNHDDLPTLHGSNPAG